MAKEEDAVCCLFVDRTLAYNNVQKEKLWMHLHNVRFTRLAYR